MSKTAIVLFNLGGPDRPEAVRPFLFNLFNDPAIIGVPQPFRWCLAKLISSRRAPIAREIYANLGGGSPLLPNTEAQAAALEQSLLGDPDLGEVRAFIAMRYWHPMSKETAEAVKRFDPDRILLLPLYPQFSTTTTGSSFTDWARAAKAAGLSAETRAICCYPTEPGFVSEVAGLAAQALEKAGSDARVLFSAHGLPKKIVAGGDPYQWQVEQSAAAVVTELKERCGIDDELDWTVCYQSRVGPLEWIGPSTEEEIERASRDKRKIVLVPIAFVSEHSETLVELDIEYRDLADELGVPLYIRVPTVDAGPDFVAGLAQIARQGLLSGGQTPAPASGERICPKGFGRCICGS